jgi:predicted metal-dependent peptidase
MSQKIIGFVKSHVYLQRSASDDILSFTPNVLIIRDTSGSSSDEGLGRQARFAEQLAREVQSKITYVAADTRVRYTITKEAGSPLTADEVQKLEAAGHGGTDMFDVIAQSIADSDVPYAAIVVTTDGYTQGFTFEELRGRVATINATKIDIPPLAFALTPDPEGGPLKTILESCKGFPPRSFLADYVVDSTPEVSLGI